MCSTFPLLEQAQAGPDDLALAAVAAGLDLGHDEGNQFRGKGHVQSRTSGHFVCLARDSTSANL